MRTNTRAFLMLFSGYPQSNFGKRRCTLRESFLALSLGDSHQRGGWTSSSHIKGRFQLVPRYSSLVGVRLSEKLHGQLPPTRRLKHQSHLPTVFQQKSIEDDRIGNAEHTEFYNKRLVTARLPETSTTILGPGQKEITNDPDQTPHSLPKRLTSIPKCRYPIV